MVNINNDDENNSNDDDSLHKFSGQDNVQRSEEITKVGGSEIAGTIYNERALPVAGSGINVH